MQSRYKSTRSVIALLLVAVMIIGFSATLYKIQVQDHEYYAAQNNTVKTYKVAIEAARGEIVDRNGNALVTNRETNSIILDAAYFPAATENDKRNAILQNLIALFQKNGEEYTHNLPLKLKSGKIVFSGKKTDIATMKSADMFNLQPYATAQNCYDAMVEKYGLEQYDTKTALQIGNLRYELTRLQFSISTPVVIADEVSSETVAAIKEDKGRYLGADVQVVTHREYTDSTLAPHILGTVRKINAEEYAQLKDKGYGIHDQIGESGIESAMENALRGTPGEKTVTVDKDGHVTEEITKAPVQGNTVVLTIDRDLQALAQKELKKVCDKTDLYNSAGAVVVQDVNTGAVLASASYPTFDLADYYDKYEQLATNRRRPLWSRFALGTYAPGSTFKPMMAVASLEEGAITRSTIFNCGGLFRYYDQTFQCLNKNAHGGENVETALRDSCNIFFYNCAKRLGITKMNEYASAFGLGQKTGVEIAESAGTLAGPEEREAAGGVWQSGDTIQAGIGQSDNLFTPLQLSNYCATVANGGTRYQLHLVQSLIDNSSGTVTETQPKIEESLDLHKSTLTAVKSGMRLVATQGAPSLIFNQLRTEVAAKTGTSQVFVNGVKKNNGFLITFAPYDNPEISVASVVELAGSGTSTAEITSSIIKYWYQNNTDEKTNQKTGALLN